MSDQLRPSREVTGLIDRIRRLVAEQRVPDPQGDEPRRARAAEIARLQGCLAIAVRRELTFEA